MWLCQHQVLFLIIIKFEEENSDIPELCSKDLCLVCRPPSKSFQNKLKLLSFNYKMGGAARGSVGNLQENQHQFAGLEHFKI